MNQAEVEVPEKIWIRRPQPQRPIGRLYKGHDIAAQRVNDSDIEYVRADLTRVQVDVWETAAKIAEAMAAGETYETGRQKALNIAAAIRAATRSTAVSVGEAYSACHNMPLLMGHCLLCRQPALATAKALPAVSLRAEDAFDSIERAIQVLAESDYGQKTATRMLVAKQQGLAAIAALRSLLPVQPAPIDFGCRVCGVQCAVAPDPPARAVCPEHCEDHDYEHDKSRAGSFCIHCDEQRSEDWDDD